MPKAGGKSATARIATGTGPKEVNFAGSASLIAFAVDANDRSYYVGDEPNTGEFRIQRFVEGKSEASISFSPPEAKKSKDGVGEAGVGLQLAVDPARNRIYALVVYKRRERDEAEEKAEEKEEKEGKTPYERFPLDSEELAAGELYAFEYKSGKLVSAKEAEGKPAPLIAEARTESSTTGFTDQSETPKEALLNPRGMVVDPATGNLAILGVEDEEPDVDVEKGEALKQCRAVGQFIDFEEKSGVLKSGKLGRRYVDSADALRPLQPECEPQELEEVPLSPAVTPGGNLLITSAAEGEGQVWELPTPGTGAGEGEMEVRPTRLYAEAQIGTGALLNALPPEEGGGPTLSFVPEGPEVEIEHHKRQVEGSIYLATKAFGYYPAPLVLHYAEAEAKPAQVSEIGWTAGSSTPKSCGIPRFSNTVILGGVKEDKAGGKAGVLVLSPWVEEGTDAAFLEAYEFGPGGSTAGCPKATVSTPRVTFGEDQNALEVPTGEKVSISSELAGADAKSIEWEFKYDDPKTGEKGSEKVVQPASEFQILAGYEFKPLEYEFKHAGTYEISEVIRTDDLAGEAVKATEILKITTTPSPPRIRLTAPAAVRVNEEAAEISATVSDPNETLLHLKKVLWNFGDGSPPVEETVAPEEPNPAALHIKHVFISRCGKGKCKITLTVEDTVAEGKPAVAGPVEITVNESKAEEAARKAEEARRAAEAAQKAAEEAAAQKRVEEAEHKKPEEEAQQNVLGVTVLSNPEARLASTAISVSSKGALTLKVTCPKGESACTGTVTLRTLSAVSAKARKAILTLANGTFSVPGGAADTVTLHLSAKARLLLSRSHTLRALATLVAHDSSGATHTTTATVTLKLAKPAGHKKR